MLAMNIEQIRLFFSQDFLFFSLMWELEIIYFNTINILNSTVYTCVCVCYSSMMQIFVFICEVILIQEQKLARKIDKPNKTIHIYIYAVSIYRYIVFKKKKKTVYIVRIIIFTTDA